MNSNELQKTSSFNPNSDFVTPVILDQAIERFPGTMLDQLMSLLKEAANGNKYKSQDEYKKAAELYTKLFNKRQLIK